MASLTIGQFACGGFILDSSHIGTAAHCFEPLGSATPINTISVQVGTNDISNVTGGQVLNATKVDVHPLFDNNSLHYDAAIITLASPIVIDGSSTRAAVMATAQPSSGSVFVAGWGVTSTGGQGSDQLLFVSLPYVNVTTCNNTYGDLLSGVQVCAGGVAGQDSCQGDSGGPLFTTTNIADPVDAKVIGIVSFGGNACAVAGEAGVYSDVPGFANSFFQGIISASASSAATPAASSGALAASSSGALAASSGAVAASSGAVAASSGAVAASSGAVAASSGAVAASSGAVAASSGAVAASSSKGVVASSSGAVVASSSKAAAASSSKAAAASSSKAAAASSSKAAAASSVVVAASSPVAAASKTSSKSLSNTPSNSNQNVAASSGAVAASSVVVAASSGAVGVSSSGAHVSATGSKPAKSKTLVGAAAIACRQTCQVTFVSCKKTTRRLRTCRRAKKQCVAGCGIVH